MELQDKVLHHEEAIEHRIHRYGSTGCLGGHNHACHNKRKGRVGSKVS
jgi:hypothetical protein